MPAFLLLMKLLLYYALLAAIVLVVLWIYPPLQDSLPIGRVQALLAQTGDLSVIAAGLPPELHQPASAVARVPGVPAFVGSLIWLGAAIIGALLASLPVSWVYMAIRNPRDYDQSLVDTIVLLPMVVTSIVVIVQHSLALAFSLAGIAGAARYRNTMKSSGDLLFILLSIGIGLSAGIGAVELAILSSAAFNFAFLLLWVTNYGERSEMKRFLGEFEHGNGNGGGGNGGGNDEPRAAKPRKPKLADDSLERKMKQDDWDGL